MPEDTRSPDSFKPPFPWFGGKKRAASLVWEAFGDVTHYIEPFFGSGGVYFNRPYELGGGGVYRVETVNDIDGFIVNFWRAVHKDPDAVATWCLDPITEIDLNARHRWLCERTRKAEFVAKMQNDPDFYDPKVAGWWAWGLCAWIGSGWCTGTWDAKTNTASEGLKRKMPHIGAGRGILRHTNHLDLEPPDPDPVDRMGVLDYLRALSLRLRYTRICCGDWKRIVTTGALCHWVQSEDHRTGIFLDPPYNDGTDSDELYAGGGRKGIAAAAAEWAFQNGNHPRLRIVLCGYEGDHVPPAGWRELERIEWGGYSNHGKSVNDNRKKERLWLSPGCLGGVPKTASFWDKEE